jgi:hypothetical protein
VIESDNWFQCNASKLGQLAGDLIHHTPAKTQEVLGRVALTPGDLLNLPQIPKRFAQRIVYLNVAVKVGTENIALEESIICGK